MSQSSAIPLIIVFTILLFSNALSIIRLVRTRLEASHLRSVNENLANLFNPNREGVYKKIHEIREIKQTLEKLGILTTHTLPYLTKGVRPMKISTTAIAFGPAVLVLLAKYTLEPRLSWSFSECLYLAALGAFTAVAARIVSSH